MKNADKRYLAALELRICKLEAVINYLKDGITWSEIVNPACGQCNNVPYDGLVCAIPDCCQGRNPADDEVES